MGASAATGSGAAAGWGVAAGVGEAGEGDGTTGIGTGVVTGNTVGLGDGEIAGVGAGEATSGARPAPLPSTGGSFKRPDGAARTKAGYSSPYCAAMIRHKFLMMFI